MSLLAPIATVQRARQRAASALPPGILVDDFYDEAHGTDDAISIRAAIAYALANGGGKVSFSNKTYNLLSAVAQSYYPYHDHAHIYITGGTWVDDLELEGNGAVLNCPGTTGHFQYAPIILCTAAIRRLRINGLTLQKNTHLRNAHDWSGYPPVWAYQFSAGLLIGHLVGKEDVELVEVRDCTFIDCHRSLEINGGIYPASTFTMRGRLKSAQVHNCQFLYPKGANAALPPGGYSGGGQASLFNHWIKDLWINGCYFDGATGGTRESCSGAPALDGLTMGGGVTTRITGCTLKHFSVEGFFINSPGWMLGNDGNYVTEIPPVHDDEADPPVNGIFTLKIYPRNSVAGIQIGDIVKFRATLDGNNESISHTFEVTAVNDAYLAPTLGLKTLSGAAGSRSGEIFIEHQAQDLPTYTHVLDNRFVDLVITNGGVAQPPYAPIVIGPISNVWVVGNYSEAAQAPITCGGKLVEAHILRNTLTATRFGYLHTTPGDVAASHVIADNVIVLADPDLFGEGQFIQRGIQCTAGAHRVHGNHVSHADVATTDYAVGIYMYSQIIDAILTGNTLVDLTLDVENEAFVNLHYAYYGNTFTNVTTLQNRYPEVYANDAAAAAASYPGPVPIGGIYTLPSGAIAYRQT